MKTILCGLMALSLTGWCSAGEVSTRPHLALTTENAPPSVMLVEGRAVGFTVDKLRLVMERVGIDYTLDILPWKRAYVQAQTQPDTCVFSTTRVPEREVLFKWVGPTHENDWTLFSLASRNLHFNSLEDARGMRIGGYNGDVRSEALIAQGFRVDTVPQPITNARKLLLERIDLWVSSLRVGGALIAEQGWEGQIVPVLTFKRTEQYLACNPAVPDELIAKMNAALRAMNTEGVSATIERKYHFIPPPAKVRP
ncbi:MAG: substrate-binding periplasmic protein [Massilia sp.]